METVIDALRRFAASDGARVALVCEARPGAPALRLRYDALVSGMETCAATLRAAGLAEGERCGLVAPQGPGFILHALAILAAGGCLAPLPDDSGDAGIAEACREAKLHHLLRAPAAPSATASLERLPPTPFAHEAAFRGLDPAYLRFTSGTTRHRKGVVLGHRSLQARLDAVNAALGLGPGDAVLWQLPMAHHFVASILLYLRAGATILLPASSLAGPTLDFAAREGATFLYASPFHHRLLAQDAGPAKLPRLRLAVSTAEGLRRDVADAFVRRFGVPLVQALGIIECGLLLWNQREAARKPEALGRPLPGYEAWLRGEAGEPVTGHGPGHAGELCIRGAGLFDAYLEPWLPAAALTSEGGFRTGDQAWRDADGDFHLAGRRANRINLAGMKFFCEEVEAVLDAHPGVARSRVSPRRHARLGEIAVAEIAPRDPSQPPDAALLRAFCRARLPAYKVPREFLAVAAIPTTETGKVLRRREDEDG